MYIKNINMFLPDYSNLEKDYYLNMVKNSNNKFAIDKFEKDFLLTLILIKFWEKYPDLIFKWWTCLNRIYFPYFRMSEDLDFVLNTDLWQKWRKKLLKEYENNFIEDFKILWINLREEKNKYDSYKLAMFTFEYSSIINNSIQSIKIDISLKNNLQLKPISWEIKSIYIDKIIEENIFSKHYINCIDLKESMAEKIRASLTRWIPAIRDFFDIWYIKNYSDFDFTDKKLLELIEIKLREVNYEYTLEENYDELEKQIETDLKPVLNNEFEFNLKETYDFILSFKK